MVATGKPADFLIAVFDAFDHQPLTNCFDVGQSLRMDDVFGDVYLFRYFLPGNMVGVDIDGRMGRSRFAMEGFVQAPGFQIVVSICCRSCRQPRRTCMDSLWCQLPSRGRNHAGPSIVSMTITGHRVLHGQALQGCTASLAIMRWNWSLGPGADGSIVKGRQVTFPDRGLLQLVKPFRGRHEWSRR